MRKKRNQETQMTHYLNKIDENSQSIAKSTVKMAETLDNVERNTEVITKSTKSKLSIIIAIIALILSALGVYIAYLQYKESHVAPSDYTIYLSSEYTKLKVHVETDLTATLNFDANVVTISAYLDSVMDGDTLSMTRNNETEWHKKVYFEHTGTYEIIATAIAPNGKTIENIIEIEVIP